MTFQQHGYSIQLCFQRRPLSQLMNFSENELLSKDCTSSFLAYCEVGQRVLKFQAHFSEVFEVLYSNDMSNYV